jgi:phospholipid N-methyltransferase
MVNWIDWQKVRVIVEYGAGTGVFTEKILERLPSGARFFAIEVDPVMVRILERRFPSVRVYPESVGNIGRVCEQEGVEEVDAIVSGLPWASFSLVDQRQYLEATTRALRPGGQFTTFAYIQGLLLPSGRRFKKQLTSRFTSVERSSVVWRNCPPAFAYRCRL